MAASAPQLFFLAARGVSRGALLAVLRQEARGETSLAAQAAAYGRQEEAAAAAAEHRAEGWQTALRTRGGGYLTWGSAGYPSVLAHVLGAQAPPVLFHLGNAQLLEAPAIGMAGTRKPTAQGWRMAHEAAAAFGRAGLVLVSGGAEGVDTAAHAAALGAGGASIVVLPQGVLTYSLPRVWRPAFEEGRLLLLSEFAPDAPWAAHAAITRNATLSALSRALCIVEPRKTGGSIRTAHCGLATGKPVFAAGEPPECAAPPVLAEAGAEPLWSPQEGVRLEAVLAASQAERPEPAWLFPA